jgi:hypothetical protein
VAFLEAEVAEVVGGWPLGRLILQEAELPEVLGEVAEAVPEAGTGRLLAVGLGLRGREVAPYSRQEFALQRVRTYVNLVATRLVAVLLWTIKPWAMVYQGMRSWYFSYVGSTVF